MTTGVDALPGVVVLGSSGFIGRRIAASLDGKARVAALSRKPGLRNADGPAGPQGHNATSTVADNTLQHGLVGHGTIDHIAARDIRVPGTLLPVLRAPGLSTVVHAVSYVGSDPVLAREVNEDGTRNVVEQCRQSGNPRLIYLGTASVHGMGPHRGGGAHPLRPASAASAARAAAERMVLDYGGEVVRPNLVFGDGDRWLAPGLLRIIDAAGGWPGDGTARLSIIDAGSLGALVAGLALAQAQPGQAFYAAYPDPVPVSELVESLCRAAGRPLPRLLGDVPEAWQALLDAGFSRHQIDLVTVDHFYPSERLWRIGGLVPGGVAAAGMFRS
ncbi:NAD-dependent epimerase/dehydratase family protein [Arthrobacter cupressi]|uniref:Nucleoside-diphosphate-sugar epimerase n=1 Tax=Arthrobacter cupressi TaxID=1045773 RepID=A0A1G8WA76_9MICC|nr:NAD-dependent epimerase/dehydratase family protein [Arthrobacter cupressi]NYD76352.1 nucleoside-diphosphate-sugar epimerase [Arthrobacter cupressi]SDJ74957.1 Nucleoside-diphosphate-sugar epimerase [Arthrobacter cupressi]